MAETPIVIKRIKKKGGHGHHGGAWKIAYADFVTAMMAFFLLMWLVSTVSEEQLEGIAEYFSPASSDSLISSSGGILGGKVLGQGGITDQAGASYEEITKEQAEQKLAEEEQAQFEATKSSLEQTLQENTELTGLKDHLVMDNTPEGMRIQLIDQENNAMFSTGSAAMTQNAEKLINAVASVIKKLPQQIAIEGNTDAMPYVSSTGYNNWDLSADRALASRKKLVDLGIDENKIFRVTGKADTDLFDPENPNSPTNRRISIILLRNHIATEKSEKDKYKPKRRPDPFAKFREKDSASEAE